MQVPRCVAAVLLVLAAWLLGEGRGASAIAQGPERPIVVLVSVDGWRWDYLQRLTAPVLTRLASAGVRADALIPVFPSKTFPNHYSIVTGLYPGRHGIVSNSMVDPALPGRFTLGNRVVQQDPRWWLGEPIWVTAERQGQIAATMFWPGSDVEISGRRPTYFRMFDDDLPNADRVDEVLFWLRQPEPRRPRFLTLYFSDVDSAGHSGGPDSPELAAAASAVDAMMGRLIDGIAAARLTDRVNLVVVSDHGMAPLARERTIVLDDYVDARDVDVIDSSPVLGVAPRSGTVDALYRALADKHPRLAVYRREELPPVHRLAGHPRVAPIVGMADDGWHVVTRAMLKRERFPGGTHGYDPRHRSMHGLFIAAGPAFRAGVTVPAFENVHVYELMCRILRLKPAPNDGDPKVTASFLR